MSGYRSLRDLVGKRIRFTVPETETRQGYEHEFTVYRVVDPRKHSRFGGYDKGTIYDENNIGYVIWTHTIIEVLEE